MKFERNTRVRVRADLGGPFLPTNGTVVALRKHTNEYVVWMDDNARLKVPASYLEKIFTMKKNDIVSLKQDNKRVTIKYFSYDGDNLIVFVHVMRGHKHAWVQARDIRQVPKVNLNVVIKDTLTTKTRLIAEAIKQADVDLLRGYPKYQLGDRVVIDGGSHGTVVAVERIHVSYVVWTDAHYSVTTSEKSIKYKLDRFDKGDDVKCSTIAGKIVRIHRVQESKTIFYEVDNGTRTELVEGAKLKKLPKDDLRISLNGSAIATHISLETFKRWLKAAKSNLNRSPAACENIRRVEQQINDNRIQRRY